MSDAVKTLFISLLCSFLLLGCSIKPSPEQPILSAKERLQRLNLLDEYQLSATLGIRSPDESVSGNLTWQQQQDDYQARMTNFLGMRIFSLDKAADVITLNVQGEDYQASNVSQLMFALTGWSLPADDMPLWLKGIAGHNATEPEYDHLGRLIAFQLHDRAGIQWRIHYEDFFNDPLALPRRIKVQSDDIRIRLVIRNWQL
ncbi:MAG: lipoprotein insertase outer membrane protein LolB [Alkalimonas sp.]|nr:lipoprotein insertase outer membrane protein LolB [Alkalimonas sp.]